MTPRQKTIMAFLIPYLSAIEKAKRERVNNIRRIRAWTHSRCRRCFHTWSYRSKTVYAKCPSCGSEQYDTPRIFEELTKFKSRKQLKAFFFPKPCGIETGYMDDNLWRKVK